MTPSVSISTVFLRTGFVAVFAWAAVEVGVQLGLHLGIALVLTGLCVAALVRAAASSSSAVAASGDARASVDLPVAVARWTLFAILVAAVVLRLYTLTDRAAWADEMWTLRNIYTADWWELLRVAFDDYWPPLHYLLLNAVARVGDTSIVWLRLPSALFGVAAVGMMYPLARHLTQSRTAGLFAAALLAGATSHVLYSQEARVYSMQVFFALLSAHFFFTSYWDRRISWKYLASTVLLTYSHSFASWYFIAGQTAFVGVAWLIWRDRDAFLRGAQSQLLGVLLWMPLVGAFAVSRLARDIVVPTYWATAAESSPSLLDLVEQYQGLAVRSLPGAAMWAGLILLALVALYREVAASRRDRAPDRRRDVGVEADPVEGSVPRGAALLFAVLWVTVPVIFSLAVTVGTSLDTFGEIRYHLTVLPGLCVLAALGFAHLRIPSARAAVVGLAVLLPALELPEYYVEFDRPAADEAAEVVRRVGTPEETVYAGGGFRALAYYLRGTFPRIGSEAWDSLATVNADLAGEYVFPATVAIHSRKWGDTYAYEKIPRRVRYGRHIVDPEAFVATEVASGRLDVPFWIVTSRRLAPDRSSTVPPHPFLQALHAAGSPCDTLGVYQVNKLVLFRCRRLASPGAAPPLP